MRWIRLSKDFETWPEGVRHVFPKGEYRVPEQMPQRIADRAIRSGVGTMVPTVEQRDTTDDPLANKRSPSNKARPRPQENKRLDS
jgi:hypothetical protein